MQMPVSSLTGLTLKDLMDAGLHFGHQTKRWNPKMKRYIFDKRNGIYIIDLTLTIPLIDEAAAFLRDTVLAGKKVLFVATKKQAQEVVQEAASACGQYYVTERWLGGTLTNNQTIRRSVRRMRQIEAMARNNNGVLSVHKKEAASLRRELDKLQKNLSGVADMDNKPGALVIIDICREQNAVKEAVRLGIPIVAMVDTNADPDLVDYVIPANDDAVRGVKAIVDGLSKVIKEANEEYSRIATERQRQREAEQAAKDAQERATRKARRDAADAESAAKAKAKLTETRKRAAKAAKDAVDAKIAAVEAAPETSAEAATETAAKKTEAPAVAKAEPDTKAAAKKADAPEAKAETKAKAAEPKPETDAKKDEAPAAKADTKKADAKTAEPKAEAAAESATPEAE
ncbi:MAG: 30S ribosomal protein S2 [Kiritimatiellae bacterium]|jgi:small subunit ribosomal protein S2|nr:30S ribosomal protein S2 [Kiritimatiellia bacterium]